MRRLLFAIAVLSAVAAAAPAQAGDLPLLERLAIEQECQKLLHSYAAATDTNDLAGIAGAYSRDGTLSNARASITGAAQIERYFRDRVAERSASGFATRHVISNVVIRVIDGDHAQGQAYETVYRFPEGAPLVRGALEPLLIGIITTAFVRTSDGWRFASRTTQEVIRAN